MNKVINLHVHSHFSILDSLSTPKDIVKKTVEQGYPGVAITDHGSMGSYGHFYLEAKKAEIKPIIGIEVYYLPSLEKWRKQTDYVKNDKSLNSKERKEKLKKINKRHHLILLAKNKKGFENLNLLLHKSYEKFYYRPRIDLSILNKYHEGLVCSSACIAGELQQAIIQKKHIRELNEIIDSYKNIFKDDYYFEIQINEMKEQKEVNNILLQLSKKHNIKCILTGDSHYTNLEDQKTHQTLLLMNSKSSYDDLKNKKLGDMNSGAWEFDTKRLYLKNYEEYNKDRIELNPEITKKQFDMICENTFDIFDKIENFEINNDVKLKDISPEIKDKSKKLKSDCIKSLKKLNLFDNKEYVSRLKYELQTIKEKGLENYFFVVRKIVNYAKKNNILVGAGRGSASGSLVVYLLGITTIDPIRFKLFFERFLARKDYPDIDVDFEDNEKIKDWILSEYKDESACVSSYSTFRLFGLVKDLGKVYGIEDAQYWNKITKNIKKELKAEEKENDLKINEISYDEAIEFSETFKDVCKKHKNLDLDMKILMNKYRHIGKHAGGVIISENLTKNQPIIIMKNQDQTSLTHGMQDNTLEKFGFIKIDVLGLKTLKIIHETTKIISERKGTEEKKILKSIHPNNIDLKYKKAFDVINDGYVSGIFQFDTPGAKQVIEEIIPSTFEDLVAINALNRPGPKQFISLYADRKHGREKIKYDHPLLEDILKETKGIMCYQEEIMEISRTLAGFTLEEANVIRKAMGKKIESLMIEQEEKFKKGCKKNNIDEKIYNKIFEGIKKFASYSFNKAHALAYAMVAYQCAFLKSKYPIEFYTALLRVETNDVKIDHTIKEMKSMGIKVKPLDIEISDKNFIINDDVVYYGFCNIKGIGEKAAETIIEARKKKPIKNFKDFLLNEHINRRVCNKGIAEKLLKSFVFGNNFEDKLEFLKWFNDSKLKNKKDSLEKIYKNTKKGFIYLRDANELKIEYLTDVEKVKLEKEMYSANLRLSPFEINGREEKIKKLEKNKKSGTFKSGFEYKTVLFKNIITRKDKNGNTMAFLDIEDLNGIIKNAIIFSSNFDNKQLKDGVFCVTGSESDKFIIDSYKNIDNLFKKQQ